MNSLLVAVLVLVALLWAACSIFYQYAVRNALRDASRFRLFALRDRLRWLSISGQADARSFSYGYVEDLLNRIVHSCERTGMCHLLEVAFSNVGATERMRRFEKEAPAVLRDIEREAIGAVIGAMAANSPWWMVIMGAVIGVFELMGWAARNWLDFKARLLWNTPPPGLAYAPVR
jgi:hypothetical protein